MDCLLSQKSSQSWNCQVWKELQKNENNEKNEKKKKLARGVDSIGGVSRNHQAKNHFATQKNQPRDLGFFQYWKSPDDSAWDFFHLSSPIKTNCHLFQNKHPSNTILPSEITWIFFEGDVFTDSATGFITIFFTTLWDNIILRTLSKHRVQSRIRNQRIFPLKSRSHFSRGKFLLFCAEVLKVICPSSPNWLKPRCSWACGMRFV